MSLNKLAVDAVDVKGKRVLIRFVFSVIMFSKLCQINASLTLCSFKPVSALTLVKTTESLTKLL